MRRQYTGLNDEPKRRMPFMGMVGERPARGEAGGRPTVDRAGARMLA